ncbi:MAG TPA: RidA family protein [Candidatus Baltobacterales bacterium]|nr:RidA family protein [Candidatus Baltobacterales bacterium]
MGSHRGLVSRRGPQPTGSYPHAHMVGDLVWVTAQAGREPISGELVEGGMAGQMDRAISNLEAILEECGSSLDRVIKTQIMYTDPADVPAMDEVYARRFRAPLPVRTSWGVQFLAAEPGTEVVRVQIDCVAEVG